jgi:hypothetical protein
MTILRHSGRDLFIGLIVISCISLALFLDAEVSLIQQYILGIIAWAILLALVRSEEPVVRLQVMVAVLFAWFGEYISSPVLGSYIYRLDNLPAYVPPGHGMVYLAAVALGRSMLFQIYRTAFLASTLGLGALWSLWGITLAHRADAAGAVLFCVFVGFTFFGRAPLVYVAAFFLTSYLELLGTWFGTWAWSVHWPIIGLTQANPPSGTAAWYCLVDAVALSSAPVLARGLRRFRKMPECAEVCPK